MEGEFWDEERWEAFLKETDRHVERYMTLLFRFMSEDPPVGRAGSSARQAWERRLRVYLLSNGIHPDDDLPRHWDESEDPETTSTDDQTAFFASASLDDAVSNLERLPVYRASHRLTSRVLSWSNTLPGPLKDSTLVQFCSHVTQIPANVAKGHGIGYEMDMIGGNIACSKRALAAANAALDLLTEMKGVDYMTDDLYLSFYEDLFHVRNDIGVYVQELRARFNLGVD